MTTFQQISAIVFWVSFALIFQSYFGTYLSLAIINLFRRKPKSDISKTDKRLLTVTILIPAHNEEELIGKKIENSLDQDYPVNLMEIVIASDVSTDRTVEIVKSYADRDVKLIDFTDRHGKLGIIDEVIPQFVNDIVVITDANVFLAKDAISRMMEKYQDTGVGAVNSVLQMVTPSGSIQLQGESTYRLFEIKLKHLMSKFGLTIGLLGGFYSVRRDFFVPLGQLPVHDDVIIPLEVLAQGNKVIHAEKAYATEETNDTIKGEYMRRVRMTAFNLNSIPRLIRLSIKAGPMVFYLAIGYKMFRWLSPYLFALSFISLFPLIGVSIIYNCFAVIFGLCLIFAFIGYLRDKLGLKKGIIMNDFYHFAIMNLAGFVGLRVWLKGVNKYWETRGL
ncbi:MAG: glycosyltransferase [Candidatus Hatepunaea meridiana]|nr:glycosyltransferase [Candidatus Hatepunaea meridiana]